VTSPLKIRVFLSSPNDVSEERRAARTVLTNLAGGNLLKGEVDFEIVAWDDPLARAPMVATETPQESVNRYKPKPSECDLTIVILWSRLGTPTGLNITRPDGTPFASGTESEFYDAQRAGKPVFLYVRSEKPKFEGDDEDEVIAKFRQYRRVGSFVDGLKGADGVTQVGVNKYDNPEAFAKLFEQHMEAEIRRRRDEAGVPLSPGASNDFSIFLATTAEDMDTSRISLVNDLKKKVSGIRLFDEVPPPLEPAEHAEQVRDYVKRADLCVHLLGARAGANVEGDESGNTYVLEQARIAREEQRPQLILYTTDLREVNATGPYKAFLDELTNAPDESRRLELVKTTRPQFFEQVKTRRRKIEEERQKALARKAFIDSNFQDATAVQELVRYFSAHSLDMTLSTWNEKQDTSLDDFRDNLMRAKHFLVVYGKVGKVLVDQRLEMARKHITTKGLSTRVGIFAVGPAKSPSELQFEFNYPVIDSTGGFNEKALNEFLTAGAVA
jgi:hypothetical protein